MTSRTSTLPPHPILGEPVRRYPYTTPNGEILYYQARFEPKDFRPQQADGTWGLKGQRVLYNLPLIVAHAPQAFIWVCEGEKDADRLFAEGLIGTTAGPAAAWAVTDTTPLRRAWGVIIVPDCDPAGAQLATVATKDLYPHVPVFILKLGGADGYDVSDYLEEHGVDALMKIRQNTARTKAPKGETRKRGNRTRRGHPARGHVTSIAPGLPYNIDDLTWALGGTGHGFHRLVFCPAHNDEGSTPGLSLTTIDDDHTLAYCHSGCEFMAIAQAVAERMK